jgi:hypothetical protein
MRGLCLRARTARRGLCLRPHVVCMLSCGLQLFSLAVALDPAPFCVWGTAVCLQRPTSSPGRLPRGGLLPAGRVLPCVFTVGDS